jgi:hypothetical protein
MLASFFLCLLGGQLVMHFTNTIKMPYTPVVFIMGIILGTVNDITELNII